MIAERVKSGAQRMGIALEALACERFARYYELLVEGNTRMNLTAVLEPEEAVDRHFLDCLAPVAQGLLPEGAKVVDVGTGAGFPGLPLLIARPDLKLTLVDALNKRLGFIQGVLDELGLQAEIVHMRAEDFSRKPEYREQYDIAAARAVAAVSPLMEYLLPCGGAALRFAGRGRTFPRKRKRRARPSSCWAARRGIPSAMRSPVATGSTTCSLWTR